MSARDAVVDPRGVWADESAWLRKLESDRDLVVQVLPAELRQIHETVVERAHQADAQALILSGSTIRECRTAISDLDYHLVGRKIETKDLSRELDLHVLSEEKLESELLAGDDFVQWSLRFGCVMFDDGAIRRALQLISEVQGWPSVERKYAQAAKSLDLARRFVDTGDEDGALEQARTALSLAARACLLGAGVFPLARAELPSQLQAIGAARTARDLAATIYGSPSITELRAAVEHAEAVLVPSGRLRDGAASK